MKFLALFLLVGVTSAQPLLTLIPSGSGSGSSGSSIAPSSSGSSSGGGVSTASGSEGVDLTSNEPIGLSGSWIAGIVRDPPIEHVNVEEEFPDLFSQQQEGTMLASNNGGGEESSVTLNHSGGLLGAYQGTPATPKFEEPSLDETLQSLVDSLLGIEEVEAGDRPITEYFEPRIALGNNRQSVITQAKVLAGLTARDGFEHAIVLEEGTDGKYKYGSYQTDSMEGAVRISLDRVSDDSLAVGLLHSHPNNDAGKLAYAFDTGEEQTMDENFNFIGGTITGETPLTGLSEADILGAYQTNTFIVAALPNGSIYYYHPKQGLERKPNPTFGDAAHEGVFGKL